MPEFIPGLELNRRFYLEVVRPLLDQFFPRLPHAAALLGDGSEVLGFDTPMSMDHDWSPRMQLFLGDQDAERKEAVHQMLRQRLPSTFLGFSLHWDPGTHVMQAVQTGPVNHNVRILTLREFVLAHSGWDPAQPLQPADWLSLSSQVLRTLVAGAVYHDGLGELGALRQTLAWYPQDTWLYLLACGWQRIGQEEHLMGRAGLVGDELGSALIAARLVRDVMSLGFLLEKQYAPYPKWFGSAFQQLDCAAVLSPLLEQAIHAQDWQARQAALSPAYEHLAGMQNRLALTPIFEARVSPFHGRPFQVIGGERFATALVKAIRDPAVQQIADRGLIGSIDQFCDNTDLRSKAKWRTRIAGLYRE